MELRIPSVEQLRTIYDRDLKEAFPAAELKPLRNIEQSWAEGWYKPYCLFDGDNIVGIDVDIAQAICDKLGYELEIDDMEFDAILAAVQSGKADFGAAGMTVTEDRLESVDFTDTYANASQVIIVKAD